MWAGRGLLCRRHLLRHCLGGGQNEGQVLQFRIGANGGLVIPNWKLEKMNGIELLALAQFAIAVGVKTLGA